MPTSDKGRAARATDLPEGLAKVLPALPDVRGAGGKAGQRLAARCAIGRAGRARRPDVEVSCPRAALRREHGVSWGTQLPGGLQGRTSAVLKMGKWSIRTLLRSHEELGKRAIGVPQASDGNGADDAMSSGMAERVKKKTETAVSSHSTILGSGQRSAEGREIRERLSSPTGVDTAAEIVEGLAAVAEMASGVRCTREAWQRWDAQSRLAAVVGFAAAQAVAGVQVAVEVILHDAACLKVGRHRALLTDMEGDGVDGKVVDALNDVDLTDRRVRAGAKRPVKVNARVGKLTLGVRRSKQEDVPKGGPCPAAGRDVGDVGDK